MSLDGGEGRKLRKGPGLGVLLLLCLLTAMLITGGFFAYNFVFAGAPASVNPVTVAVEEGESLSAAAQRLEEKGAIGSAAIFELQARLRGLGGQIKPGEYRINPGDSNREILGTITSADEALRTEVSLPEGLTLRQTAERVAGQSDVSEAAFRQAARKVGYGYDFLQGGAESTEGFLFPKQYEFAKGISAQRMVDRMLEQYLEETVGLDFSQGRVGAGLTEYEVVTVASLVEREASGAEERPVVASVIYNRLREGMPLQIDATVQYALGVQKESLSLQDLEVDSPYNTYEREGLPPGPIASSSLDSIEAALNPARTDYLYYVLEKDGESHTFTESYDEFLRAKERAGR